MTIKLRIIIAFLLATVLLAGSTIVYMSVAMRSSADAAHDNSALRQATLMNYYVMEYIETAQKSAEMVAKNRIVANSLGVFPNFTDKKGDISFGDALHPDARKSDAMAVFIIMNNSFDAFVEVFAGYRDGSIGVTDLVSPFPGGYNPTKRDWFAQTRDASSDGILTPAYLSTTGSIVLSATHKMYDDQNVFSGVAGIDLSLSQLAKRCAELNYGLTGFFMIIENTGRILCDPKNPASIGKIIGTDIQDAGLSAILRAKDGTLRTEVGGVPMRVAVQTNPYDWQIVFLQTESEIIAPTQRAILMAIAINVGFAVLVLLMAYFIVRSINRPLGRLMTMADQISHGNLNVNLDGKGFYGELAQLQSTLVNMFAKLKEMILTADQKSKEAEANTRLAQQATAEAEKAHAEAVEARREGVLEAADKLENAVEIISSASVQLSAQIEESGLSASESARLLSEATNAINRTHATMQDMTVKAGRASEMSSQANANAEHGEKIVKQALTSIEDAQNVSKALKSDMAQLNEHARDITRIMAVISDIADQTNLLALNAAIEAARAGEAGRGFSVVADEVRKLAEKTMISTHDVGNAITAIQESTSKSATAMDKMLSEVETAATYASQSGEALRQIVDNASEIANQVQAIATASEEQSTSSEDITHSIYEVNSRSSQTAQAMQEAACAVSDLAQQAHTLSALLTHMKQA